MASVWAARQQGAQGFSRVVALKTILPELSAPDLDGMFLDEARVAARIHHPNVCEVFELIEHGGVLALSMEWVDGETLNNILASRPKEPALAPRVAAQVIAQVAFGLHAAHELRDERGAPLQLVHRDVSPENILISRTGQVKITDFGVAKSLGGMREATAIGKVKGKLSYMSPEQAQGKVLDRRSDIFSLGVVLYLATVGSHPFRRPGEARNQQLARLLSTRIKRPSELVKGYPKALESIVMRALARSPAQRFRSAEEMARRLQAWVLASGPPVTHRQIAQMVLRRAGPAILARSERIATRMFMRFDASAADDALPPPVDPTLVPTTSHSKRSLSPEHARARATLRAVSTTLTAGALGLAASFVFSAPSHTPHAELLAPAALGAPLAELGAPLPAPPASPSADLPAPSPTGSAPAPSLSADAPARSPAGTSPATPSTPAAPQAPAPEPSGDSVGSAVPLAARNASPLPVEASAKRAQKAAARKSAGARQTRKAKGPKRKRAAPAGAGSGR